MNILRKALWKLPLLRKLKHQEELINEIYNAVLRLEQKQHTYENKLRTSVPKKDEVHSIHETIHDITGDLRSITESTQENINQVNYLKSFLHNSVDVYELPRPRGLLNLLHQANFKALLEFDRIARKHQLIYWLDFGTLIGALRYKNFIPWDDDLDVSMTRESYEKLSKILAKEFRGSKFFFVKSELIRIYYEKLPIQLDVMPWDFYSKKIESEKERNQVSLKLADANKKVVYDWGNVGQYKGAVANFTQEELLKLRDEKVLDDKKPGTMAQKPALFRGLECPTNSATGIREVVDYDIVFPLKEINFNGRFFPCPNLVDEWLFCIYRDANIWPNSFRNHSYLLDKIVSIHDYRELKGFVEKKN